MWLCMVFTCVKTALHDVIMTSWLCNDIIDDVIWDHAKDICWCSTSNHPHPPPWPSLRNATFHLPHHTTHTSLPPSSPLHPLISQLHLPPSATTDDCDRIRSIQVQSDSILLWEAKQNLTHFKEKPVCPDCSRSCASDVSWLVLQWLNITHMSSYQPNTGETTCRFRTGRASKLFWCS